MNQFKLIKTDPEHEQALERLMALMERNPERDTAEANELDLLALIIEHYEQENYPIDPPDPIAAIKFRMDQMGLTRNDLADYIGSASKVSEVLNGKRTLSLNMIRRLSAGLGLSADVLIREPAKMTTSANDPDWQAFPLAEMRKRGYFANFHGSLQEIREYAEEYLDRFLASVPDGFSLQPAMLRSSAHLRSNDKEMDSYALWAWQVRVLKKAQDNPLQMVYVPGTLNLDFMRKLAQESWSDNGPLIAVEYLNQNGIHLIVEPHLPKTYLDGAACIDADGHPVIALTLRYDRLDNFWFTLMHELAHIHLHLDHQSKTWFIDDLDASDGDRVEQEADALAQEAFVPPDIWDREKPVDHASLQTLARKLNISPAILAGRLRHEQQDHTLFGTRYRDKVRATLAHGFTRP